MNIKIIDRIGLQPITSMDLACSLIRNRPPKEHSYDYRLETHEIYMNGKHILIQVTQSNKRKSDGAPIEITIEKHIPIL